MNGAGIQLGGGLLGGESIPVMEAVLAFADQRQAVLLNNVANWSTPNFRAKDLPEDEFRRALSEAIQRRATNTQPLRLSGARDLRSDGTGGFKVTPVVVQTGAMRHDGNSVVIDQEQAKLLKNGLTVQVFSRLLSRKFRMLRTAISERLV